MANRNDLAAYTSSLIGMDEHADLQERLKLYQVFLKLYDHHRGLLNEILSLENSAASAAGAEPYIQGLMSKHQSYLLTNLIGGKTQALTQPQHTWVIGRDSRRVSIPIQDIRLSRCHAAIKYVADQGFYLIDLGSRNQSIVNGEPIRQALLKDGDQVRLGSVAFTFYLCQSTRTLPPLPPEMQTLVEHWQLSEPVLPKTAKPAAQLSDLEDDGIPTLDLYHETSGFLRVDDTARPV